MSLNKKTQPNKRKATDVLNIKQQPDAKKIKLQTNKIEPDEDDYDDVDSDTTEMEECDDHFVSDNEDISDEESESDDDVDDFNKIQHQEEERFVNVYALDKLKGDSQEYMNEIVELLMITEADQSELSKLSVKDRKKHNESMNFLQKLSEEELICGMIKSFSDNPPKEVFFSKLQNVLKKNKKDAPLNKEQFQEKTSFKVCKKWIKCDMKSAKATLKFIQEDLKVPITAIAFQELMKNWCCKTQSCVELYITCADKFYELWELLRVPLDTIQHFHTTCLDYVFTHGVSFLSDKN